MGDAGVAEERKLINRIKIGKIDILKVGHHGSSTSSEESFINSLSPFYSVISVGRTNRFNHPNPKQVKIIKQLSRNTLLTSINGSVKFIIKSDRIIKSECRPFR